MSNRVIITCPYFVYGGGVATFYKVYAKKQTQKARLFYIGKDRPCGSFRTMWLLFWQYIKLFLIMPKYDLLVVNPSLKTNAIPRDTFSVRIARFWGKKTCVFWRGFNEEFFDNVVRYQYKKKLQKGLFNVSHTIVLGKNIYEKYHSIGLNTPYSLGSTFLEEEFMSKSPKSFRDNRFCILFMARLIKEKGVFESLDAFKVFQKTHPEAKLVIAGNGEELTAIENIISSNCIQNISLMGDVRGEKKKACFEEADVYLFPSYTEGMPNSVLEAMGMGLPIISSSVGAVPDFFEDGKMGILMKGHSTEETLCALELLYSKRDIFPEISEYNRYYAANHFVDKIVIEKLEHVFSGI